MIVSIHQPEHLPWLGFFNKLSNCDLFVILDNVQYRKNYFQNRNQIIGIHGAHWISVPIETKGHTNKLIREMIIANKQQPKWRKRYISLIETNYRKHPYFYNIFPLIENIINRDYDNLTLLNMDLIQLFTKILDIETKIIYASELNVSGNKSDLILNICKKLESDNYLAGPSGRDYLNFEDFKKSNIKIHYNDFIHPKYKQSKQSDFVPFLSTLDLLMNEDPKKSKEIILSGFQISNKAI